ncbi:MAG: hypothetical protein IJ493_09385 [Clostridia bacterium]|nr:hypothetical protein [Clostridia bacterium]
MDIDESFRQLYQQTYVLAASLVTARCRQTADAGDIIQEIYLEVYRILKKHGAAYIREPEAMVRRLAKQKLFWYYRELLRHRKVCVEPMEDGAVPEMADIESLSVEEVCEDREAHHR